eukprot:831731-Amphidinium_carterae.1
MDSGSRGMKPLCVLSGTQLRFSVRKLPALDLILKAWLPASLLLPIGSLSLMDRAKKRTVKQR